jgi:hypothetical protein
MKVKTLGEVLAGPKDTTLAEKGRAYYKKHLKELLEPEFIGQFVAIEPDSGRYFVGKNTIQTMAAARGLA